MARGPRNRYDVHELCAMACERLKSIGFEKVAVSRQSEAVYFRYPGRHGVLRVSCHKNKHRSIGLDIIVAKLTFRGGGQHLGPYTLECSPAKVENMIAIAVGQYMINSAVPLPSRYKGKRGTWENEKREAP